MYQQMGSKGGIPLMLIPSGQGVERQHAPLHGCGAVALVAQLFSRVPLRRKSWTHISQPTLGGLDLSKGAPFAGQVSDGHCDGPGGTVLAVLTVQLHARKLAGQPRRILSDTGQRREEAWREKISCITIWKQHDPSTAQQGGPEKVRSLSISLESRPGAQKVRTTSHSDSNCNDWCAVRSGLPALTVVFE